MLQQPFHIITNGNRKRITCTKKSLEKYGLESKIFQFERHPTNGRLGCFHSHINLYKYAQHNNLEYIIICEDSIIHTMKRIPKKIQEEVYHLLTKPNWNIILLGGWFIPFTRFTKTNYSSIYKTNSIHGTSCYIIHKRFYSLILKDYTNHFDEHIDKYLMDKSDNKAYIVSPVIFTRNNVIPTSNTYFSNKIVNMYYYINCSKSLSDFWQYYAVHYEKIWLLFIILLLFLLYVIYYQKISLITSIKIDT